MKCLILGGTGFLGSHLSEALLNNGHTVRVFAHSYPAYPDQFSNFSRAKKIEWIKGDFLDAAAVNNALTDCEVVYHLISTTLPKASNEAPIYDVQTNLGGTLQLLELMRKKALSKIIFASSGGIVYGLANEIPIKESHPTEPRCAYGINKLAIEKYLDLYQKMHGLEYCIFRIANPYGERQRVTSGQGAVTTFLYKTLKNEVIEIWGDGQTVRDYIYVCDVVDALVKASSLRSEKRLFNIGSGQGKSLNELIDAIETLLGKQLSCRYLPQRSFDVPTNILDITQAQQILKWQPQVSFTEGLSRTWDWMQKAHLAAAKIAV